MAGSVRYLIVFYVIRPARTELLIKSAIQANYLQNSNLNLLFGLNQLNTVQNPTLEDNGEEEKEAAHQGGREDQV